MFSAATLELFPARLTAISHDIIRWRRLIVNALEVNRIQGVIDVKLLRPNKSDRDYSRWRYWSILICGWLQGQIDDKIIDTMEGSDKDFPTRADDFMKEIGATVHGEDITHNVRRQIVKFSKIHRNGFTTAESFILAYQIQYTRYDVEPHPSKPLFVILHNLENELRTIEHFYENAKDKEPA